MTKRIGITGNIGAGKTTVAREFERLGIPVYYADARARELMQSDGELRAAIAEAFDERAYTSEGQLNRTYLAERVFERPTELAKLNALVHPAVARDALHWHRRQSAPYTLHEAAILLEIGAARAYDALVVVTAPYPVRLRRVMERDGATEEAVATRAARQWTEERKARAADFLIVNDGLHLLLPQVLRTDRQLRALRT